MNREQCLKSASFCLLLAVLVFSFASCKGLVDIEALRPKLTVTFAANGGSPAPKALHPAKNSVIAEPAAMSRAGYLFDCWYKEAAFINKWDFAADTVKSSTTLYARWVAEGTEYTVTFNPNGGSPAPASPVTVNFKGRLGKPAAMSRGGYVFSGWYRGAAFTAATEWNFTIDAVIANTDLYARWILAGSELTVAFNANGGSPAPDALVRGYGDRLRPPIEMARTGYIFSGWYSEAALTHKWDFASQQIGGNTTLHAGWSPVSYAVAYSKNAADAAGAMQNSSHRYDTVKNLTANIYARNGYTFEGWNTEPDGSGTAYADGHSVLNLRITDKDVFTLYAQWKVIHADSVTLNKQALTLFSGESETLTATVSPGAALNKKVHWASSASGIAAVDQAGKVSALAVGTVRITVTTEDGGKTAYCDVTVIPVISITSQPAAPAASPLIAGNISGTMTVAASISAGATLNYQWYSNTINSNAGGTEISGATSATYTIPAGTVAGTYHYYCEVRGSSGAVSVRSNVVTVVVRDQFITSSSGIEMIWVPVGSFELGRELGTAGSGDTSLISTVTLSSGFYLGKYEVTQEQYQALMGSNPSNFNSSPASGETQGRRPVDTVSWYDAIVFCNKLSMKEGLTPAYRISGSTDPAAWGAVQTSSNATWNNAQIVSGSTGYRLPTEAQWEYAAKGGSPGNFTYAGSNDPNAVAWYYDNSNSRTHEVGKKAPNGLGLYDMSGNVFEWCWDWYGSYTSSAKTDPLGASSGSGRVGRGGDWGYAASSIRSVYRGYLNPSYRSNSYGFRVARP